MQVLGCRVLSADVTVVVVRTCMGGRQLGPRGSHQICQRTSWRYRWAAHQGTNQGAIQNANRGANAEMDEGGKFAFLRHLEYLAMT